MLRQAPFAQFLFTVTPLRFSITVHLAQCRHSSLRTVIGSRASGVELKKRSECMVGGWITSLDGISSSIIVNFHANQYFFSYANQLFYQSYADTPTSICFSRQRSSGLVTQIPDWRGNKVLMHNVK